MDVARAKPRRRARTIAIVVAVGAMVVAAATAAARATEHPVNVPRGSVWTGRVERGPLLIRVKGPGVLLPEKIRWLTAESSGRVEEVLLKPGVAVEPDTVVIRLENLDIRLQAVQADHDVASSRSELLALQRKVAEDALTTTSDALQLRSSLGEAERRADVYARGEGSVVTALDSKRAAEQASELAQRTALADERVTLVKTAGPNQVGALRTQVERSTEVSRVRHELVDHLVVRAGASGILQDVPVELGQWVVPGTVVAKVIVSERLKAELRIPEEQAGGIAVGQVASIDTRSGTIPGHVRRIASAATQGAVKVEIALDGEMPRGARPDQNVDGWIEIDRADDTLHVPRPVLGQPNATVALYRVDPATRRARRIEVRAGRASIDSLEILSGLQAGDEVVLSDMTRYANADVVELE